MKKLLLIIMIGMVLPMVSAYEGNSSSYDIRFNINQLASPSINTSDKIARIENEQTSAKYNSSTSYGRNTILGLNRAPNISFIYPSNQSNISTLDFLIEFVFFYSDIDYDTGRCFLYIDNALKKLNSSVTPNKNVTFLQVLGNGNYRWFVNCTDGEFMAKSDTRYIEIFSSGSGAGGGGGGNPYDFGKSIGISNLSIYLCNKTYDYILNYGVTSVYIDSLIQEIELESNETSSFTLLETYINNWQGLCSDIIGRTLEPETVCNKIYSFILINNYNYTYSDIINLNENIKEKVSLSISLLVNYLSNYDYLCYQNGYSSRLDKKKIESVTSLAIKEIEEPKGNYYGWIIFSILLISGILILVFIKQRNHLIAFLFKKESEKKK